MTTRMDFKTLHRLVWEKTLQRMFGDASPKERRLLSYEMHDLVIANGWNFADWQTAVDGHYGRNA